MPKLGFEAILSKNVLKYLPLVVVDKSQEEDVFLFLKTFYQMLGLKVKEVENLQETFGGLFQIKQVDFNIYKSIDGNIGKFSEDTLIVSKKDIKQDVRKITFWEPNSITKTKLIRKIVSQLGYEKEVEEFLLNSSYFSYPLIEILNFLKKITKDVSLEEFISEYKSENDFKTVLNVIYLNEEKFLEKFSKFKVNNIFQIEAWLYKNILNSSIIVWREKQKLLELREDLITYLKVGARDDFKALGMKKKLRSKLKFIEKYDLTIASSVPFIIFTIDNLSKKLWKDLVNKIFLMQDNNRLGMDTNLILKSILYTLVKYNQKFLV